MILLFTYAVTNIDSGIHLIKLEDDFIVAYFHKTQD